MTNIISQIHVTSQYSIKIEKLVDDFNVIAVQINYKRFSKLCKKNCINYLFKYSCPPYTPPFNVFALNSKSLRVICYRIHLDQYAPLSTYNRIRAANAILKSLIDRELLSFKKKGHIVTGSGSCRACKPCGAKIGVPCKKPERRIYSLEAMGVDVGALVKECFGFELQWYIKGKEPPEYTCVVGAVLL